MVSVDMLALKVFARPEAPDVEKVVLDREPSVKSMAVGQIVTIRADHRLFEGFLPDVICRVVSLPLRLY
jgi:hypothetical protein